MITRLVVLATLALTLPANAQVYGPKGNDTGGIIPWSPETQRTWRFIANSNCNAYGKYAVFSSMRRRYGEYIVYECRFERHYHIRHRVVVTAKG